MIIEITGKSGEVAKLFNVVDGDLENGSLSVTFIDDKGERKTWIYGGIEKVKAI